MDNLEEQTSINGLQSLSKGCLWLAISSLFLGVLTGLPAVVCGHIALFKLKHAYNKNISKKQIVVGLALGYLSITLSIAFIVLFFYSGYPM